MALKKNTPIPDDKHVLRHVSPNKLRKDANGVIIGILGTAFMLRDKEAYLSATMIECYQGTGLDQQVQSAIQDARTFFKVKPKSGFAVCKVGIIKALCVEKKNIKLHIVSCPTQQIKTHVAIKHLPVDDQELLDLLACEECSRLVLNSSVP